jgi:hypothetical protein
MRTILDWKCGCCNSVQKSDSAKRWSMDHCKCGKSFVDLEEYYQRNMGEVIVLNTSVFGEIDAGDPDIMHTTDSKNKFERFLRETKSSPSDLYKKPLTPDEAYEKKDEGINEGINEGISSKENLVKNIELKILFIVFGFFILFLLGTALGLWVETSM